MLTSRNKDALKNLLNSYNRQADDAIRNTDPQYQIDYPEAYGYFLKRNEGALDRLESERKTLSHKIGFEVTMEYLTSMDIECYACCQMLPQDEFIPISGISSYMDICELCELYYSMDRWIMLQEEEDEDYRDEIYYTKKRIKIITEKRFSRKAIQC